MPRPQSEPSAIEGELLEAVRDAQHALLVHLLPCLADRGLSKHLFFPLWYLSRTRELHPGDLARGIGVSAPACTQLVDHLVAGGFVARRASATDRRHIVLAVTPKGRRTLEAVWRELNASLVPALRELPAEDVRGTARTLRAFARRLGAEPPARAPEVPA
ncbi:MAG TPA: MarR family transcriptional regulator [Thermoplasmata archaeon]|nr:MarR family transcriptional regulator [Thermoplasmata archaeon]